MTELLAPMRVALRQRWIIERALDLRRPGYSNVIGLQPFAPAGAVSFRKRNCQMFQALFQASVNHNDRQTSWTNLRSSTRALLLGFK